MPRVRWWGAREILRVWAVYTVESGRCAVILSDLPLALACYGFSARMRLSCGMTLIYMQ